MFEQHDDAIDLLKRDHREVESLFAEFDRTMDDGKRIQLAQRICSELSIHARVEEELFYPAARDALGHDDIALVYEANVEHGTLKQLIGQINGSAADAMFDARMQVLKEYVQHHVREEEMRLMPAVRRSVINLESLGDSIGQRKRTLAAQAQSQMAAAGAPGRVHVPGIEPEAAAGRRGTAQARPRKNAGRKANSTARARTRPAKRRAAGKRKSNPESQRRPVARRKV